MTTFSVGSAQALSTEARQLLWVVPYGPRRGRLRTIALGPEPRTEKDQAWYFEHVYDREARSVFAAAQVEPVTAVRFARTTRSIADVEVPDRGGLWRMSAWVTRNWAGRESIECYVPRELHAEVFRCLRRNARRRSAVAMYVVQDPEHKDGRFVYLDPEESPGSNREHRGSAKPLEDRFVALALHVAQERESEGVSELPPLKEATKWRDSEVHHAARDIVTELGRRAFTEGWSLELLRRRVYLALEALNRLRAGGLGRPLSDWEMDQRQRRVDPTPSFLASRATIDAVLAAGGDPVADKKTAIAYRVSVSFGATQVSADADALSRLRELPELVAGYLDQPWFRYAPISASLARATILAEYAQFADITLRKPAGWLDGSFTYVGESWAYQMAGRGRRPGVYAALRLAQGLAKRILSTLLLGVALGLLGVPYLPWILALWFLAADRLRLALIGPPAKSELVRSYELLDEMRKAYRALDGDYVSVATFKHVLAASSHAGVAWYRCGWDLIADAERRGEAVWEASHRRW